jgi:hypothetical protein
MDNRPDDPALLPPDSLRTQYGVTPEVLGTHSARHHYGGVSQGLADQ